MLSAALPGVSDPIYRASVRAAARRILPLAYRGSAVSCPCCERDYKRFIRRYRWDALCPGCLSLSRHRLLWLYLRDRTDLLSRPQSVLHFAPEEALEQRLRRSARRYVGADLHPQSPAVVEADITAMPFGDEEFDVVLCNHVLEHIVDDRGAMSELHRVLRPTGRLYMVQPLRLSKTETLEDPSVTSPSERRRLFGQRDHVRVYGRDFITRLEEAGFRVRLEQYLDDFSDVDARRYGLVRQPIFDCVKPAAS